MVSVIAIKSKVRGLNPEQGDGLLRIHPMELQHQSALGLLYLLPPQCSIISGQLPVATAQKSGSIPLHHSFPSFPGLSN
jgi:hypothetical protein